VAFRRRERGQSQKCEQRWQAIHGVSPSGVEPSSSVHCERNAHSTRDANVHVVFGCVSLAMGRPVSPPVEASQKKKEQLVNEATGPSDAGWSCVANHSRGPGTERVREEVEREEAQAMLLGFQ